MDSKTYSLKEVAYALNRSGTVEENDRLIRSIRHWTAENVLKPIGTKHTGTGRSRLYSAYAVRFAALLVELHKWRIPVTALEDEFSIMEGDFADMWWLAIQDKEPVFLMMSYNAGSSVMDMTIDYPNLHIVLEKPEIGRPNEPHSEYFEAPASLIVINLSRLLRWVKL